MMLNISLPQPLSDYVEQQARERGYKSPSEYVEALLHEDQERRRLEVLECNLLEGLTSGDLIEVTHNYWEGKRNRLTARYSKQF